mmetsp:Transcript_118592/g.382888  ORF Transcript_118592/g.382888 Transcript_118592/m.382888 type:complete len:447 (+) Transcript_118592:73-1413(+)
MSRPRQSIRWQPLGMKRGVFFDFDSTLTTPIKLPRFHRHAVADRPDIFASMTSEEIIANFGGRQRIARLATLFRSLAETGTELFIVSIGFRDSCIIPHLRAVGLAKFFLAENIYGQDSEALRSREFAKGRLIASLMTERGWEPNEVLFIDDSARHVEGAASVCEVLKVSGRGLSEAELEAIAVICQEGHVASDGHVVSAAGATVPWRLRADEGVPEAVVAVGAWRVIEVPAEKVRAAADSSPLAAQRRVMDKSPMISRRTAEASPMAAPSRRAVDASPPGMGRRALDASPSASRQSVDLSPLASKRAADASPFCMSRRAVDSSPRASQPVADSSPPTSKRTKDASPFCMPLRAADASPLASRRAVDASSPVSQQTTDASPAACQPAAEASTPAPRRMVASPLASRQTVDGLPMASRHISMPASRRTSRGGSQPARSAADSSPPAFR